MLRILAGGGFFFLFLVCIAFSYFEELLPLILVVIYLYAPLKSVIML